MRALSLLLTFLVCGNAWAGAGGLLRLYRWAPGLKAENVAAWEAPVEVSAYQETLRDPAAFAALHEDSLFTGCYLVVFEPGAVPPPSDEQQQRMPASTAKAELHKICFSR